MRAHFHDGTSSGFYRDYPPCNIPEELTLKFRVIGGLITSKYRWIGGERHTIGGRQNDACYEHDSDSEVEASGERPDERAGSRADHPRNKNSQSTGSGTKDSSDSAQADAPKA